MRNHSSGTIAAYATHGYTETCTHCQAVIPVRETLYIDGENKRCPKCGEAYKVPGSELHPSGRSCPA